MEELWIIAWEHTAPSNAAWQSVLTGGKTAIIEKEKEISLDETDKVLFCMPREKFMSILSDLI